MKEAKPSGGAPREANGPLQTRLEWPLRIDKLNVSHENIELRKRRRRSGEQVEPNGIEGRRVKGREVPPRPIRCRERRPPDHEWLPGRRKRDRLSEVVVTRTGSDPRARIADAAPWIGVPVGELHSDDLAADPRSTPERNSGVRACVD